jgi:hypothetical protein
MNILSRMTWGNIVMIAASIDLGQSDVLQRIEEKREGTWGCRHF